MLGRLSCLTALAVAAASQPPGTGVIAGTVVMHGSGEPVRKAVVIVNWQGTPRAWGSLQSDGSGRFRFDALPPGQYNVTASKEGSGSGSWGPEDSTVAGRLLTLAAGEQRTDLQIRLIKPSVITGVIADPDGDAMPFVDVQLLREGYPRGVRELQVRGSVRTNDRGEYRFANVEPGKLYIAAQMQRGRPIVMAGPGEDPPGYARQFYPGTTEWRQATPLLVRSGDQIRGIDLRLAPVVSYTVRGRVTGLPPFPAGATSRPVPAWQATVQLSSADETPSQFNHGTGINPQDGTFQIRPVPPGRYWLTASATVGDRTLGAAEKLDIRSDPGELNLTLMPPVAVRGKVSIEGTSADPVQDLTVELTPGRLRGVHHHPLTARPRPDGAFGFPQVPPGIWDIGVKPIPKGGYLKSMHLGEQDVLTEEMEIGRTVPGALNIVVSSRGGKVSGELVGEAGKRTGAMIILAPAFRFQHVMSFYAMGHTVEGGRFELTGITPGKYRLYAVEMLRTPIDPRNPDILGKLNGYSEMLEIEEGASVTATPVLIPADKFQEAMQ